MMPSILVVWKETRKKKERSAIQNALQFAEEEGKKEDALLGTNA